MRILIVDGYDDSPRGQKRFRAFKEQVLKALKRQGALLYNEMEFVVKKCNNL